MASSSVRITKCLKNDLPHPSGWRQVWCVSVVGWMFPFHRRVTPPYIHLSPIPTIPRANPHQIFPHQLLDVTTRSCLGAQSLSKHRMTIATLAMFVLARRMKGERRRGDNSESQLCHSDARSSKHDSGYSARWGPLKRRVR